MGTTADKLAYLNGTKTAIKNAIVAKGVAVPDGTTFRAYADKIGEISGGGGEEWIEYSDINELQTKLWQSSVYVPAIKVEIYWNNNFAFSIVIEENSATSYGYSGSSGLVQIPYCKTVNGNDVVFYLSFCYTTTSTMVSDYTGDIKMFYMQIFRYDQEIGFSEMRKITCSSTASQSVGNENLIAKCFISNI